ncbi:hypothetical protein Tco_0502118 [Tanacetum coccineum]
MPEGTDTPYLLDGYGVLVFRTIFFKISSFKLQNAYLMSSGWNRNVRMALDKEIAERYGQSNEPLIYPLGRELRKITQGNLTISSFFNKLKKCWDEFQNINSLLTCDCGRMRECTCDVLAVDLLPIVNKAYYIVQQIEKQKQVTNYSFEPTAFFVNLNNKGGNTGRKDNRGSRNDGKNDGKKAKKQGRIAANISSGFNDIFSADTPFDMGYKNEIGTNSGGVWIKDWTLQLSKLLQLEKVQNDYRSANQPLTLLPLQPTSLSSKLLI